MCWLPKTNSEKICLKYIIIIKTYVTSSAANLSTAVKGVASGTLNLKTKTFTFKSLLTTYLFRNKFVYANIELLG